MYGAGGSGFITPGMWMSPLPSGAASPVRGGQHHDVQQGSSELMLEGQSVGVGA